MGSAGGAQYTKPPQSIHYLSLSLLRGCEGTLQPMSKCNETWAGEAITRVVNKTDAAYRPSAWSLWGNTKTCDYTQCSKTKAFRCSWTEACAPTDPKPAPQPWAADPRLAPPLSGELELLAAATGVPEHDITDRPPASTEQWNKSPAATLCTLSCHSCHFSPSRLVFIIFSGYVCHCDWRGVVIWCDI